MERKQEVGMTGQLEAAPTTSPRTLGADTENTPTTRWSLARRFAFRFVVAYLALFALTEIRTIFPLLGIVGLLLPIEALMSQYHLVSPVVTGVAGLFGVDARLIEPVESGDQAFFWVLAGCWALGALIVSLVWSIIDRRRPNYATGYRWFQFVLRFGVAAQLFAFGFAKLFPVQMSLPLTRLVEPFGDFSLMNVMWMQVGSSPPYEILLGCAEITAGFLLVVPRTALLGALLAVVDLTQVLLLNITYQVPLKIFTFHLLVLSLIILVPHAGRLRALFLSDRSVGPAKRPPLRARRAARVAIALQVVLVVWLAGSQAVRGAAVWSMIGAPATKPPLYGIWNVVEFSLDGQDRPPLTTDGERWNRFIVDLPHSYQLDTVSSQRMDGSIVDYTPTFDVPNRVLVLTRAADSTWSARLAFAQAAPDRLTLDGDLDGRAVHVRLERADLADFPILDRGAQWVQDRPAQPRLEPR
jgi:hypothetical protein